MSHLRKRTVKGKPGREEEGKGRQERGGWGCFIVSEEGTGRGHWTNNLIWNYNRVAWHKSKGKALLKLKENHSVQALEVKPLWFWFNILGPFCFAQLLWLCFLIETKKKALWSPAGWLVLHKQARKDFINSSQKDTVYKRNNIKILVASLPRLFMFLHARHIIFW